MRGSLNLFSIYDLSFLPRLRFPNDLDELLLPLGCRGGVDCYEAPLLITTLAPSLPRIPRSCGFGLCPLPRFLFKKPSIPVGFWAASISLASAGNVASFFASSDQLPPSPRTTWTPPPWDSFLVPEGRCCRLYEAWYGESGAVTPISDLEEACRRLLGRGFEVG